MTVDNVPQTSRRPFLGRIPGWLRQIPPIYLILLVLLVWVTLLNPNFIQPQTFLAFLRRAAPLLILAAGQLFVIASGGFDLSVGSLITLTVLGSAVLLDNNAERTASVIGIMYLIGLGVGIFNATVVNVLKVSSFITTLGMLLTLQGFALFWSGGAPAGYLPDNFREFGRGVIEDVPLLGRVPYAVIVLIVFGAVSIFLFHATTLGKQIKAVGDNPRAALLSGVRIGWIRLFAFIMSSLSAVTAGILLGGFAGASVDVGNGYELEAISAVVLGGAALMGGRGSVLSVMVGALTLRTLFTLLNLLGLSAPIRFAVQGLILMGAAAYTAYMVNRTHKNG